MHMQDEGETKQEGGEGGGEGVTSRLVAHGPVTQCEFLHGLGVRERAQVHALFQSCLVYR